MIPVYTQRDGVLHMRGRPMADADAQELLAFHARTAVEARAARLSSTEEIACSLYSELKDAITAAHLVRKLAELDALLADLAAWGRRMRDQLQAAKAGDGAGNIVEFQRRKP